MYGSYLTLMATLKDNVLKPTQEIINSTFSKHHLQDFVISTDCLKICELLGAGEIYVAISTIGEPALYLK